MKDKEQTLPEVFTFITAVPTKCQTVDQAKAILKCRFQRELDEYFDTHKINLNNNEHGEERGGL